MNSKHKGEITEAIIIAEFLKLNISVARPFGDNQPYDLIIDINGGLKKVQIKTGRLRNGVVIFNAITSVNTLIDKRRIVRNYIGKIDYFAIYCPDTTECYLVPISECTNSQGTLRVIDTKNCQKKKIKWAKNYILSSSSVRLERLPDT